MLRNFLLVLLLILQEIIIGLLLGDLNAEKQSINGNTRLRFAQGLVHEAYLFYLYELFKDYSSSLPRKYESKTESRTGKIYSTPIFQTYSLPCFNKYYELFYLIKVKIVF